MKDTKNEIAKAAIEVVSKKGYHQASMDEIATQAKVAKGTLYYHFKNKEQIFTFIIDNGLRMIKEEVERCLTNREGGKQQVAELTEALLNLIFTRKNLFRILISQLWGHELRQVELRKQMLGLMQYLKHYIEIGIETGVLCSGNPERITYNYFGTLCSSAVYYMIKNPVIEKADHVMVQEIVEQFC